MKLSLSLVILANRLSLARAVDAAERGLRGADGIHHEAQVIQRVASGADGIETVPAPNSERHLSGRVIMKPKSSNAWRSEGKSEAEIAEKRGKALGVIKKNKVVVEETPGLGFSVVLLNPGQEKKFIKDLEESEDGELFEYLVPDYIESQTYVPNDQFLPQSWQHDKMQSRLAWDTTFGSDSVTVAICDSGLLLTHPDLAGNRVEGYNADQKKWESDGGDPSQAYVAIGESHGTWSASSAAAIGNNGIGTIGSGGNFKHRPIQVSNAQLGGSAYSSTLAHCAEVACNAGDRVVNISYSGATDSSRRSAATYCRQRGALVFHSAGNDDRDITGYNTDADDLIVVGATDSTDNKSSFSAYGSYVDIMAPGSDIVGAGVDGSGNPGYYYISGTSFSSPLTAGLAALIWSANPNLTADEVEQVIKESADDLGAAGKDNVFSYGRINSYQAMLHPLVVGAAPTTPAPTSPPTPPAPTSPPTTPPPTPAPTPAPTPECSQYNKRRVCNRNGCVWTSYAKTCSNP